jgi:hypothetical protein
VPQIWINCVIEVEVEPKDGHGQGKVSFYISMKTKLVQIWPLTVAQIKT